MRPSGVAWGLQQNLDPLRLHQKSVWMAVADQHWLHSSMLKTLPKIRQLCPKIRELSDQEGQGEMLMRVMAPSIPAKHLCEILSSPGENPALPSQSCPSALLPSSGKFGAFQVPGTNEGPTNTQLCPPVLQPPAHPFGLGAFPCHWRHICVSLKRQSEGLVLPAPRIHHSFQIWTLNHFPGDKPPQVCP